METTPGYGALVRESLEFPFPEVRPRQGIISSLPEPALFNLVHIITGVRRSGKTFYEFQLIHRLLAAGVPRDRIFYFNFADDRLKPASTTLLNDVLDEYWRQVPEARKEGAYLFLDEVQESDEWQGFCQRVAEHEKVTLVITGSSSKLSSDQIASTFRGRSLECHMLPLSFAEYCRFHSIELPEDGQLEDAGSVSPQMKTSLESAYDRYLIEGGFPGVQALDAPTRTLMLQSYVRDVIARDVVERSTRLDVTIATQMALFALRDTACDFSVNRLLDMLRRVGYHTSWDTVNEGVHLLEQSYLISMLKEYSVALAEKTTAIPKVYACDQGMAYAVSRASQQDVGKRLETAIYVELMRRARGTRPDVVTSYTAPTTEKVDFLVGDSLAAEPYLPIQVTADMSRPKTRKREVSSLERAMNIAHLKDGLIITLREEAEIPSDAGHIRAIPAWKWSLMKADDSVF
ncbi:MAG: ATP-binding protein [Coriobacteriaceae bacterium]|nr:MAG: ATP-binding protein [Coriobacteriaceae bacterium]